MDTAMNSQGGRPVSCTCWNNHFSFGWRRSGFLIRILGFVMGLAIVLPYMTAMALKAMPAFLPFISQAGGSPPQTGIFGVFMILMAFSGIFTFPIFHETISHRNTTNCKKIRFSNNASFAIICICCLGCIVTIAYPIGYTSLTNKFEWIISVLLEHGFGACMVLFGTAFFQFLIARVWWLLPDTSKREKYIKIGFCVAYVILFFTCVKPMPTHLYEELGPEPLNIELLKNSTYDLPLKFSVSYLISAVCEWTICLLSLLNFLTFYKDLQRVSCRFILRPKTCEIKSTEAPIPISLKSLHS